MRKYRATANSEIRIDYGLELLAGLALFPETQPLAAGFEAVNDDLAAAYEARRKTRPALVKARVALRFANYEVDQAIRSCSKAAEIADGGRRGPIFGAAFPEGHGPVVAPTGARQIKPTEALLSRMQKSKVAGMAEFAATWVAKIEPFLVKLAAAAKAYEAARKAYLDAFQDELAMREDHLLSVDRLMGQVRSAFPRDKVRQDLVFPVLSDTDGVEVESAEEEPEDPDGSDGTPA